MSTSPQTARNAVYLLSFALVVILAAMLLRTRDQLQMQIRAHMAHRDAESLYAVLLNQRTIDLLDPTGMGDSLSDPSIQFELMLKTTRIRPVIAARLFTFGGDYVAGFPETVTSAKLSSDVLTQARLLRPASRFLASPDMDQLFQNAAASAGTPLLAIALPIHEPEQKSLLGVAEFWLDATTLEKDYATMDQGLSGQTHRLLALAILLVMGSLFFHQRRLDRTNRDLEQRTRALLQANHELAIANKTTALGAVSAHLIHGIKNPLAGVQAVLTNHRHSPADISADDWGEVGAAVQRMQDSIREALRVLQEHPAGAGYEVSSADIVETVESKVGSAAHRLGVRLITHARTEQTLSNHRANLVILILENLTNNALEATPRGGAVRVEISSSGSELVCRVQDQGTGLPEARARHPFQPGASAKPGGSGLGLAITKQLANSLSASLELESTSGNGSCFKLVLSAADNA